MNFCTCFLKPFHTNELFLYPQKKSEVLLYFHGTEKETSCIKWVRHPFVSEFSPRLCGMSQEIFWSSPSYLPIYLLNCMKKTKQNYWKLWNLHWMVNVPLNIFFWKYEEENWFLRLRSPKKLFKQVIINGVIPYSKLLFLGKFLMLPYY